MPVNEQAAARAAVLNGHFSILKVQDCVLRIDRRIFELEIRSLSASERIRAWDEHLRPDKQSIPQDHHLKDCWLSAQITLLSSLSKRSVGVDGGQDFFAKALALLDHRRRLELFPIIQVDRSRFIRLSLNEPVIEVDPRWTARGRG